MRIAYILQSYCNHRRFKQAGVFCVLQIGLLVLFGCSDNTPLQGATPVGAMSGLNTFIFFYTDN